MERVYVDVLSVTPDLEHFDLDVRFRWKTEAIQVDDAQITIPRAIASDTVQIRKEIEGEIKRVLQRQRLESLFAEKVSEVESSLVANEWTFDV